MLNNASQPAHQDSSSCSPYYLIDSKYGSSRNNDLILLDHQVVDESELSDYRTNKKKKKEYYTLAGRNQQQSRQFPSRFYYKQVGTFLTQYKIRENYKFLQMISVPPLDPAVPKPESGVSVPACGEPLVVPSSFPQSIEAALHKFANASSKTTCISVLDQSGKAVSSLTYGNFLLKKSF